MKTKIFFTILTTAFCLALPTVSSAGCTSTRQDYLLDRSPSENTNIKCVKNLGQIRINKQQAVCTFSFTLVNTQGGVYPASFQSRYTCNYRAHTSNEHVAFWLGCPFSLGIGCAMGVADLLDVSSSQKKAINTALIDCNSYYDQLSGILCEGETLNSSKTDETTFPSDKVMD